MMTQINELFSINEVENGTITATPKKKWKLWAIIAGAAVALCLLFIPKTGGKKGNYPTKKAR